MPAVPHYPSDEPDSPTHAPDLNDLVDRIIRGGDERSPPPTAV